jgi:hypothetical protein
MDGKTFLDLLLRASSTLISTLAKPLGAYCDMLAYIMHALTGALCGDGGAAALMWFSSF